MKKFLLLSTAIIALLAFASVSSWKVDPAHSRLGFSVTHLGIADVSGSFKNFDVQIKTSKDDFSDASIELTADVSSIDTDVEMRDNHLKSPDFFDAAKYPKLSFKSTSIKPSGEKNRYHLTGDLTMLNVTRSVTLDLWYRGTIENQMNKKPTSGFKVTGVIKRSDFGIGKGFQPPMISDEVRIQADGEFVKQ